jgi:hypothetical protein
LFDQWPNLAANVQAALTTLGFDCLGITDELNVELVVDTTPLPAATTRSGNFDALAAESLRTANTNEEKADNAATVEFSVQSILFFTFFDGEGQEPTSTEINALIEETKQFFTDVFEKDPTFAKDFIEFHITDVVSKYNDKEASDRFEMNYKSTVVLKNTAEGTITSSKQVAKVMGDSDYNEYITNYVWLSKPFKRNEFYNTHAVEFDGWAIDP